MDQAKPLTVLELIERLERCPPDAAVQLYYWTGTMDPSPALDVSVNTDGAVVIEGV